MIPTLIFGVSAANAALGGTVPFATPFLILVALSLDRGGRRHVRGGGGLALGRVKLRA